MICKPTICKIVMCLTLCWCIPLLIIQLKMTQDRTSLLTWSYKIDKQAVLRELPVINHVNPHPYSFTIAESDKCSKANYNASRKLLIVVVQSIIKNHRKRKAIRETWGQQDYLHQRNVKLVFLFGNAKNADERSQMMNESHSYHDIIQGDFVDSYRNLSIKTVAMLKWVKQFCPVADYVLKTDDDVLIHVDNLLHALQTLDVLNKTRFILGQVWYKKTPERDVRSKWYVSVEEYHRNNYPMMCPGSAYVISGDIVEELFNASLAIDYLYLEDVFVTGLCAEKVRNLQHIHDQDFHPEYIGYSGCNYRDVISGHYLRSETMYNIWKELMINDVYKTC